ncbi:ABC transporter ATP-binding protein [Vibrio maerlii]|uniref:ABC transporter ATP-binding protein n=1 Tax=Vibrio maerlii TaxID=2231648 RepID=UPI003B84796D
MLDSNSAMPLPASGKVSIDVKGASLRYLDSDAPTLSNLNLIFDANKWTVLLGRSGCGKTTVLRYLAGLLDDKIEFSGGFHTSDTEPLNGKVAYMAQQDLLLPWLSVLDNACLSSKFDGSSSSLNTKQKAKELLERVGLADYLDAMPNQLSGGMRQRVALARTLIQEKPVVLMDEPFSALDAVTRYKLQTLAAELLKEKTVVLITHDPQEAVRLADTLYVLHGSPAKAEQLGVPSSQPPRVIDGECAKLQQTILEQLEVDYA